MAAGSRLGYVYRNLQRLTLHAVILKTPAEGDEGMRLYQLFALNFLVIFAVIIGCGGDNAVDTREEEPGDGAPPGEKGGAIAGTILPPGISPLVVVLRNGIDFTNVIADEEGNYTISNLPAGEYSLQVVSTGFFTDTSVRNLQVKDGETVKASLIIMRARTEAATLLGKVVDQFDGQPLADAEIQIECSTGVCAALSAVTGQDGKFSIDIWSGLESNINVRKLGYRTQAIKVRALAPLEKFNLNPIALERFEQ
jgi:hypothetical protein